MKYIKTFNEHSDDFIINTNRIALGENESEKVAEEEKAEKENSLKHIAVMKNHDKIIKDQDKKQKEKHYKKGVFPG